ncbi:protein SLOW GREEN 1, chloroplastic isoform X2 [Abrus precatorius]|uniref:Protein SLOW GREEN 1, chloroplastic isoform X2 n=1 Tax=Abrus precatorius TaxID=3816 RepID=A0A8B8K4C1_ABRPR|nr:protein SLOW GREEN 1, chloroplastic isoform X2 [Abrus precatorius]
MASTSITTFSIYSQSQTKFFNLLGHPLIHSCNKRTSISFQPAIARTTLFTVFTCSHTPCTSTSKFSPGRSLSKFLSEKIAFFLIGSFIFMGCFSRRVAFAETVPSVGSGAALEEKMKPTEEKSEEEEEEMCEKILEKDPRNVEALKVVLYGKIRRGKSKEALKFVEDLIAAEPNQVEWRLLLALCYETMGRFSTAKRLLKEILQKKPLLVRALHSLAMVMHKNHEGPAVFEMLNKAQELASRENRVTEERNIRILIAQMHVVQDNLEEGLKRFQDLIDENPRDFRPYLCQGIIYSLLNKGEEAAQQFETYQTLVPEEFPQRGFLDDVTLAAKRTSREQFLKEFRRQFSYRK